MEPTVTGLRCERLVDPVGVGTPRPRLSWVIAAPEAATEVTQEAWQLQVGQGEDVAWDTGRVVGWQQTVHYDGPTLPSRARRWWRVRAWTSAGHTAWSERGRFELGILDAKDWSASMITAAAVTPVVRFWSSLSVDGDVTGVATWLHRTVAGLAPDPEDPGYHHVFVRPRPGGGLTRAAAELRTRYGRTAVAWTIDAGELVVDVVIPPNAWATVELPAGHPVDIGSGERRFTRPLPRRGNG